MAFWRTSDNRSDLGGWENRPKSATCSQCHAAVKASDVHWVQGAPFCGHGCHEKYQAK